MHAVACRWEKDMKKRNADIMVDIAVIGAGASGMMAAISAAEYLKSANIHDKKILLIEKNEKAGKKILATGNGRCNLTNLNQNSDYYMTCGQEYRRIQNILSDFNEQDVINFFDKHGMLIHNKDGYIYPKSMQAQTVADILTGICQNYQVEMLFNTCVCTIQFQPLNHSYRIQTEQGTEIEAKRLILSTGSSAAVKPDYNGYSLAKNLGHSIISPLPALCGLEADKENIAETNMGKSFFKNVTGVRTESMCKAIVDGICVSKEIGELQLTDYGLSGIVIFCLSRHISRGIYDDKPASIIIDFIHDMEVSDIVDYLYQSNDKNQNLLSAVSGIMNSKLAKGLINILSGKYYGISLDALVCQIKADAMHGFINEIKNFEVVIKGTNGFERAQVCCGGVDLSGMKNDSLESTVTAGLYVCGELLDVDGICGGYNLQWAWASGHKAGIEAATSL